MTYFSRRGLMRLAVAAFSIGAVVTTAPAQEIDELVIAYNVNLPSWDPTVGPSAVNPTIQGIYQSVFDQFIAQAPDLQQKPGILTEWGWNPRFRSEVHHRQALFEMRAQARMKKGPGGENFDRRSLR